KSLTNFAPAPRRALLGRPATDTVAPSADLPAPWTTAETGVNPSGSMSFAFGAPAARSLISLPPFSQTRPPTKTPWAPDDLPLTASASYDDALPSHAVNPATLMPSFTAAFLKLVATPRP